MPRRTARRCLHVFALPIVAMALWASPAWATVHAQSDAVRSPFPSDRFTVADFSQNTRLRVNLPKPDCAVRRSDCEDIDLINTLDGFSVRPLLSIPFDGPIDVRSVTSETVFLLKLGNTLLPPIRQQGQVIGINRLVWDPATLTLFAEPDDFLEQHTRYSIVVTRGVRDADGNSVAAAPGFEGVTVAGKEVAVTSVFTTQSVTAILEKIRDQIKAQRPKPADFLLGPGGARTLFALDQVQAITLAQQTAVNPPRFNAVPISLAPINVVPGAVRQLAFGKYLAPDYMVHPGEFIPRGGTRAGTPQVYGTNEVYFTLYLTFSAGGRSFDQNGDGVITQNAAGLFREGDTALPPRSLLGASDGVRQNVADLMQLVRVIQMGVDVDGDLHTDLDPARIYGVGFSFGGVVSMEFHGRRT